MEINKEQIRLINSLINMNVSFSQRLSLIQKYEYLHFTGSTILILFALVLVLPRLLVLGRHLLIKQQGEVAQGIRTGNL